MPVELKYIELENFKSYKGFRISSGNTRCAKTGFFAQGYKVNFDAPLNNLDNVVVPFDDKSNNQVDKSNDQYTESLFVFIVYKCILKIRFCLNNSGTQ